MKIKIHQPTTIHLFVEQLLRHRAVLTLALFLMLIGVTSLDGRFRGMLQEAYTQGWGWIGTYMHHEHPMHTHSTTNLARIPTISGPGL